MRSKSTTNHRAPCLLLLAGLLALTAACAGAPPAAAPADPQPPVETGAAPTTATAPPDDIAAFVPDGVALDPAWLERATHVFVGAYDAGMYPHTIEPDGSHIYYTRSAFRVEQRLRGELAVPEVVVTLGFEPRAEIPSEPVSGRRYLVLLAPTGPSASALADADHVFTLDNQLGSGEIVAIVDLEASDAERAAHAEAVETHARREAFELRGPDDWQALRDDPALSTETMMSALHVAREQWLETWCLPSDVARRLGPPDQSYDEPGSDELTEIRYLGPVEGGEEGQWRAKMTLTYDVRAKLYDYAEGFERYRDHRWLDPGHEAKRDAGLSWHHVERSQTCDEATARAAAIGRELGRTEPEPGSTELASGLWMSPGFNHTIYSHGGPAATIASVTLEVFTDGSPHEVALASVDLVHNVCFSAATAYTEVLAPTEWRTLSEDRREVVFTKPASQPMHFDAPGTYALGFDPVEVDSSACVRMTLEVDGAPVELHVPWDVEREEDAP